ncbi:type VII secretion integral membrane protein EccD [Mycobacterium deserti]|uniref:Type VII secretion integral membrane protein EccD n=1 Tax=Mycobacterium deserti TaxID=2978347 RepID=A0ABT2MBN7_9MYCO|nr:type VII secretion integral membrane protein EccD [Mycobacterium deserti]MCT7659689.1 type VII secretion integral membrane protein EccD [Mycobacterium deserti]
MTGVSELRHVHVVSAAPDMVRVSVIGGRTQLDVALPADVPIAAYLPELAQLISSRDSRRDDEASGRDERRTFWVLTRVDGNADLMPEQSLRDASITNGELLRMSQRPALSPPALFDDVVDAAARLNRASYAGWDATAAGVMAIAGMWLATAVWMYFLVTEALSAHRGVVVVGAVLTLVTMVGGATLVHRALGRTDIAAAAGVPTLALTGAIAWTLGQPQDNYVRAGTCAVLLILVAAYYRLIRAGRWAYIATAVAISFATAALLGFALSVPVDVLATVSAVVATQGCLVVAPLTARLERSPTPTVDDDRDVDEPSKAIGDTDTGDAATIPSAEQVWARVRSAALARAGLWAGLAAVAVVASVVLLRAQSSWAALSLILICAGVLGLRSGRAATVPERAALGLPALMLVFVACAQVQGDDDSLRLTGVVLLAVTAIVAIIGGLVIAGGGAPRWIAVVAAYLEYLAVASLVPVALWPLGIYERLDW